MCDAARNIGSLYTMHCTRLVPIRDNPISSNYALCIPLAAVYRYLIDTHRFALQITSPHLNQFSFASLAHIGVVAVRLLDFGRNEIRPKTLTLTWPRFLSVFDVFSLFNYRGASLSLTQMHFSALFHSQ